MKGILKIKLGSKVLELEGEGTSSGIIKGFAFWSALPEKCGKCGDLNISLFHRKATKGEYFGLKCIKCTADLTFHQHKEGGGFYLTPDDEWSIWQPEKRSEERAEPRTEREAGEEPQW